MALLYLLFHDVFPLKGSNIQQLDPETLLYATPQVSSIKVSR